MLPACTSPLVDAASLSCWDIADTQPPVAWSRRNELTAGFSIQDINTHCLEQFRHHWKCLDTNNHQLWQCRPAEWKLNKCVFENLVCLFVLPSSSELRTDQCTETREGHPGPAAKHETRRAPTPADLLRPPLHEARGEAFQSQGTRNEADGMTRGWLRVALVRRKRLHRCDHMYIGYRSCLGSKSPV